MTEAPRMPRDKRALIAVDLGAESCRVSLLRWREEGAEWKLIHRFRNAPIVVKGALHWDLRKIECDVDRALRQSALLAPEGIASIAVDGWAVDYVRLDSLGAPLGDPYCYRDKRTVQAEEVLHQRITPERIRKLTGIESMRINTLYQLHADALAGLEPRPWLNLPEYLLYRLGGARVAEMTNASHSQLAHVSSSAWCHELFEAAKSDPACAPIIVPSGTVLGRLTGALATLTQFSQTMLIAPACHDTASAIAGIAAEGDDWAYISSGTWSLVGTVISEPLSSEQAAAENFSNLAGTGGTICFHKNVNGMWLLNQCLEDWNLNGGSPWKIAELIAAAERVSPPARLLDVDDPLLLLPGEMPRRINRQRSLMGEPPLDERAENAPAFASLILHSLASRYATVLARVATLTGKQLRRLFIVGGGSKNSLLNRLTAKTTGLQVICGHAESATIGNFAVQLATRENPACSGVLPQDVAAWARTLQRSSALS